MRYVRPSMAQRVSWIALTASMTWVICPWAIASRTSRLCSLRSEEHTSELQSLMRISYAVFCLKKKKHNSLTPRTSLNTPPHRYDRPNDQSILHLHLTVQYTTRLNYSQSCVNIHH